MFARGHIIRMAYRNGLYRCYMSLRWRLSGHYLGENRLSGKPARQRGLPIYYIDFSSSTFGADLVSAVLFNDAQEVVL